MIWLAVGAGGALGSLARYAMSLLLWRLSPMQAVPYATFVVNIAGCLAIGVLAGLLAAGRLDWTPTMRAFVLVGVLGGFTTFSSFGLDTHTLAQAGHTGLAVWNVAGQVVLGLLAVFGGFALARGY